MESFTCRLIPILLLFLFHCAAASPTAAPPPPPSDTDFIKTSCGATRYPSICYKTLSSYASTVQSDPTSLASAALNVTLKSAKSAAKMVSGISRRNDLGHRDAGAVIDCVENMGDSVDQIRRSMVQMKDLKGPEFGLKMGNVQTWVSAALTDENTCMDGFEGSGFDGKIRKAVRSRIVKVAQLTSNALALINRI